MLGASARWQDADEVLLPLLLLLAMQVLVTGCYPDDSECLNNGSRVM